MAQRMEHELKPGGLADASPPGLEQRAPSAVFARFDDQVVLTGAVLGNVGGSSGDTSPIVERSWRPPFTSTEPMMRRAARLSSVWGRCAQQGGRRVGPLANNRLRFSLWVEALAAPAGRRGERSVSAGAIDTESGWTDPTTGDDERSGGRGTLTREPSTPRNLRVAPPIVCRSSAVGGMNDRRNALGWSPGTEVSSRLAAPADGSRCGPHVLGRHGGAPADRPHHRGSGST